MRNLEADKKIWEDAWLNQGYRDCAYFANSILPHAIERAIKAEDRVETLQIVAKENYRMYENTLAENARLRKVVDAARKMFNVTTDHDYQQAVLGLLAELDEGASR